MKKPILLVLVVTVFFLADRVWGDEVIFNNGDKLTGDIKSLFQGKLTISGTVVGEVTVDLLTVKTFSTNTPVETYTTDQRIMIERITHGVKAGEIKVAEEVISLTQICSISPKPGKKDGPWAGSVFVGGLMTHGNTRSKNLNFSFNSSLERRKPTIHDRTSIIGGYFFGRQRDQGTGENITTSENWFVQNKYDYFWAPVFYTYGLLKLEHDRIANLDYRLSPGVGIGYQWSKKWDLQFMTELGANYVYESYADGGNDKHMAMRAAYHMDKKFKDFITFFHNLEYLPSLENLNVYNLNLDAGFKSQFTEHLFTEFKFEWKRDSTPAPGALRNDSIYTLGVGWNF